jgi:hypothetical protein
MIAFIAVICLAVGLLIGYASGADVFDRLTAVNKRLEKENKAMRNGLMKVVTGGNPVLEAQLTLEDLDKS